jgi:hypothetical protein
VVAYKEKFIFPKKTSKMMDLFYQAKRPLLAFSSIHVVMATSFTKVSIVYKGFA